MNKTSDKFCPYCGHHLYTSTGGFWCIDCQKSIEEPATFEQVQPMRFRPTCLNCHHFQPVENELGMGECKLSNEIVSCDFYCDKYKVRLVTL